MSRKSRPTEFPIACVAPIRLSEMATSNSPGRRPARPIQASAGIRSISTVSHAGYGLVVLLHLHASLQGARRDVVLVLFSLLLLVIQRRPREAWADEICLWTVPVVVLFSMSFLTDINLGLRYVLSIAPYVFIAAGQVVPWVEGLSGLRDAGRPRALACVAGSDDHRGALDSPALSRLFQLGFGGAGSRAGTADRQQSRLGPGPGRPSRVVPRACARRNRSAWLISDRSIPPCSRCAQPAEDQFDWFLPPVRPGSTVLMPTKPGMPPPRVVGPASALFPATTR